MISRITFITGNKGKFEEAQKIFSGSGIDLIQQAFETPEIQSENTEEIARFSATFVGEKLNKPLFVMDRGLFIESLNGFPGPFIKFINKWLSADDLLKLLEGEDNRKAYWVTVIGLYFPGEEVKVFIGKDNGNVPTRVSGDLGYMADKIFQPEGSGLALSEMTKEKYDRFWESSLCWKELIDYLKQK